MPQLLQPPTAPLPDAPLIRVRGSFAAGVRRAVLHQLLDQLTIGVIVVDADAQPHFLNLESRRILDERDGLTLRPTGLAACSWHDTVRLRQAIASVHASATPGGTAHHPGCLSLQRPMRHAPLLLSFFALAGNPPLTAIYVHASDHRQPVSRSAIAQAFGLTPREAALAGLLADGRDLHDCALALSIGDGTVRTHLKQVFLKTATHSQKALVAELLGFSRPCRPASS